MNRPGSSDGDGLRVFVPPRPVRRLLARLLPAGRREEILRDLEEVGARSLSIHGPRRAR